MTDARSDRQGRTLDSTFDPVERDSGYQLVARAIDWLQVNHLEQPSLATLAQAVGVSDYHLQRLFRRWAGVTPKQFCQYLTHRYARQQLAEHSVLESALAAGLSGSSRLHDLTVQLEGATPGDIRSAGGGLQIRHGKANSPFGPCFVAQSQRGICALGFLDNDASHREHLASLRRDWPAAHLIEDDAASESLAARIFQAPEAMPTVPELRLYVPGSQFQIQVWQALLSLPTGHLTSYGQLAEQIGKPSATRAVASAVARNRVGWLIPCHRVILQSGHFGQYRWNATRKQAMIGWEAAQQHSGV